MQQPPCKYCEAGLSCHRCTMGPCRIIPPHRIRGVCGADADLIVARNLLDTIATGSAAHSDHGRDILETLYLVGMGKTKDYGIADPDKLRLIAKEYGITIEGMKSTGLYATDPVLLKNGVKADYWKTGHSYMKRRTHELGALAGFEKSGHYFFNMPFGRGYDDGFVSALAICDMLDRNADKKMSQLKDALPKTWGSPTMSPHCDDERKYGVVDAVVKHFEAAKKRGDKFAGQAIRDLVTVNGVRVTVEDGTWGLVRASSNKPELVVVVESPASEARMREMFKAVDGVLRTHPEVGKYNQTI